MKTTSPLGPTLVTPRLILRPTDAEDFERWAEFMADPVSARFLGGVQPRSTAWRGFATMAGSWVVRGYGMFSLLERATGRWVGRIGPWQPDGWPGTEVGWGLHPDSTGKGYAVEAATAAIDWAFDHLGWTEVVHAIAPENLPSAQVAQRLGSRILRRSRLPPPLENYEVDVWGQSREEWRARRTSA
jgi:RimJ/RimL family protein N-acetyltransferase